MTDNVKMNEFSTDILSMTWQGHMEHHGSQWHALEPRGLLGFAPELPIAALARLRLLLTSLPHPHKGGAASPFMSATEPSRFWKRMVVPMYLGWLPGKDHSEDYVSKTSIFQRARRCAILRFVQEVSRRPPTSTIQGMESSRSKSKSLACWLLKAPVEISYQKLLFCNCPQGPTELHLMEVHKTSSW